MIPQRTVAADLTRSEGELSLKPGYAVEDCHALSSLDQDEPAYRVHHMVPETTPQKQGSYPSNAAIVTQMNVVADLTLSED